MNPRLASIVWGMDGMQVRALSRRGSGQRELLLVVVTLLASGHFRWGVCLSPVARTWPALSVCLLRTVLMFPSWHPGPLQGSAILSSLVLFLTLAREEDLPRVQQWA